MCAVQVGLNLSSFRPLAPCPLFVRSLANRQKRLLWPHYYVCRLDGGATATETAVIGVTRRSHVALLSGAAAIVNALGRSIYIVGVYQTKITYICKGK